jgi:pimeloyl-ACP methyl ester carboxylesterase
VAHSERSSERLTHHCLILDDGHRVGISIGGQGIPLVFLHGIGLNRLVYLRFLSRLSALGFRVIAIDAAAHGHTAPLAGGDFRAAVALLNRALDALGLRQAVVVGHSMGGRMAIELAATKPEQVLAAVLLDPAAGGAFDEYARRAIRFAPVLTAGLIGACYDTTIDWWRCGWRDRRLYGLALTRAITRWSTHPHHLAGAMRAVAGAASSVELVQRARSQGVPFIVVHGEKDILVPFENARMIAEHANAPLYQVPRAYHSWMIADPRRGAEIIASLMDKELGVALQCACDRTGGTVDRDVWVKDLLVPGGLASSLGATSRRGTPPLAFC